MTGLLDWLKSLYTVGVQYICWLGLATLVFSHSLEKRKMACLKGSAATAGFLLLGMLASSTAVDGALPVVWYFVLPLVNMLVIMSYCQISWREAFQCALLASLTEHLANSVYILIFVSNAQMNLAYCTISLLVYACIWFFWGRKMAHTGHYYVTSWGIVPMTLLCLTVQVFLSYECKHTADPNACMAFEVETVRRMLQLCQWYAIAFCCLILALEYTHQKQLFAQAELAVSHELLHVHEQQFRLTRDNIDLINRKCHDMKHQVTVLMAQKDGTGELTKRYGHEILKMIEVYDNSIDTGNEVLNTVLRDKSLYCSMNDINWMCAAHGEQLNFMNPLDLVCIIGNALDNAVEAVERIPDKKRQIISVKIATVSSMMQILIENTFDGEVHTADGQLLTRKQDAHNHGLGVRSIRATTEKYGGYASTTTEGDTFILNILIPIPNAAETVWELGNFEAEDREEALEDGRAETENQKAS